MTPLHIAALMLGYLHGHGYNKVSQGMIHLYKQISAYELQSLWDSLCVSWWTVVETATKCSLWIC